MLTVAEIQYVVCEHYGIEQAAMLSKSRKREVAWPRQTAMYLSRRMVRHYGRPASFSTIGQRFRRDHSTVLTGYRAVQERIEKDPETQAKVAAIIDELRS